MGTPSSPTPERLGTPREPVEVMGPDVTPEAAWRRICGDHSEAWLAEIGAMRVDDDDLERSMDIWSVMLIAALREPARRDTAAALLARLRRLSEQVERA